MTETNMSRSTLSTRRVLIACAVAGVMLPGLATLAAPAAKPAAPKTRTVLSPFTLSRVPVRTAVAVKTVNRVVVSAEASPASGYVPNPDTDAGSTRDPGDVVAPTAPVVIVNDPAPSDDF